MHRIPSELRSQACSGESSTGMGDPLGSPRVAPLFYRFFVTAILFKDLASAFVHVLTNAREAGGSGPVNTTPELSVPGWGQCQDG